ncbi:MAG TPA: DUF3017 domain-containing protein [Jatrophihabitans sp.]|uniref:DUF3017 domain-containing protein n=1 Tax=Jatrophihabitans sp. TaxID=1932789 RepID=UPI002E013F18|nr:DUF3017 domain-containing protein [Jatrophihabitans sp.]
MLRRARHWIGEQFAFLLILAGVGAAFLYLLIAGGHWRRGTAAISVVVLLAGLLRLTLPTPRVGLLAVRNRWIDTFCYLVLGGLILAVDLRLHR